MPSQASTLTLSSNTTASAKNWSLVTTTGDLVFGCSDTSKSISLGPNASVTTLTGTNFTGNAATTTKLQNARTVGGVAFDGSANIDLPGVNTAGNQNTTGNADTATKITSITNADIVQVNTTQTLTNKTLTSCGLNSCTASTPTVDNQVATKAYVDSVAEGLDIKASCVAATTGNINLSGTQTIDGIAIVATNRVLVKDQTDAKQNGIYLCAASAWSRSSDMDAGADFPGAFSFIESGTTNASKGFVCTNSTVTLGSTDIAFSQFSDSTALTAGNGIGITGNAIHLNASTITAIGLNNNGNGMPAFSGFAGTFCNIDGMSINAAIVFIAQRLNTAFTP